VIVEMIFEMKAENIISSKYIIKEGY